ncbi:hypothetical protein COY07_02390 [Candidatus Peregrinibacteria bacterium CG_4_10_14_0_2_um_filter_43_11]|nr:MAG: hypothetical protein COY07_02390 [Candidatus Peregrinibacteria bacterium CG_4_10_14_0_2_um_filter_43_11]
MNLLDKMKMKAPLLAVLTPFLLSCFPGAHRDDYSFIKCEQLLTNVREGLGEALRLTEAGECQKGVRIRTEALLHYANNMPVVCLGERGLPGAAQIHVHAPEAQFVEAWKARCLSVSNEPMTAGKVFDR